MPVDSRDGTATTGDGAAAGESAMVMSANVSVGSAPAGPEATGAATDALAGVGPAATAGGAAVERFTTDSYILSISGTTASTLYISLLRSSAARPSCRCAAGSRFARTA